MAVKSVYGVNLRHTKMKILLLLLCVSISMCAKAQLVVNEFSQGKSGSTQEYIELVVVGTKTCSDSTADLRNWIFDDQNGWYGGSGSGIATGNYRFKNVANWEKMPYGSIILLYNPAEKNTSIKLADDPTDANKDYVYVVPITSSYFKKKYYNAGIAVFSELFLFHIRI